jgi:tetratricopeptide (TPR) repeat protein
VRAIELVRKGELRAAKHEFEQAFEQSPHPSVLYNLARVCFDLGELDEARRHGELYLATATPETPEQQRHDIRRMLEALARRDEPNADSRGEPPPLALPDTPASTAAIHGASSTAPTEPNGARARPSCPGCVPNSRVDALVASQRGRTAGVVLGATGVALLAVGGGILLWNGAEATDAARKRDALAGRQPPGEVVDQAALLEVIAYERAVSENQAAFRSVERFDIVGWSTVGVGAALLGTGAALFLTHGNAAPTAVSLRRGGLVLTTHF